MTLQTAHNLVDKLVRQHECTPQYANFLHKQLDLASKDTSLTYPQRVARYRLLLTPPSKEHKQ